MFDTGSTQRGEVMVFRYPEESSKNYIKRVIGLPGDRIRIAGAELFINGEKVERQLLDQRGGARGQEAVFTERLGDTVHLIRHEWLLNPSPGQLVSRSPEGEWEVPEDSYFVMGDNRDNSKDSRFIEAIPESHLVGEAVRVWMHMDGLSWPRWDRIGLKIQ